MGCDRSLALILVKRKQPGYFLDIPNFMGFKLGLIDDCSQCIYKPLKFKFKYLYYVHILCLQQKRYF